MNDGHVEQVFIFAQSFGDRAHPTFGEQPGTLLMKFINFKTVKATFLGLFVILSVVNANGQETNLYDHHVHVLSPRLIQDWKSIGMEFSRPEHAYSNSTNVLDQEKIAGAFLVSMSHLYTTEGFLPISKTLELGTVIPKKYLKTGVLRVAIMLVLILALKMVQV